MTPEKLMQQIEQRRESVVALANLWQLVIGNPVPSHGQFVLWLDLHPFERMVDAIRDTGSKQNRRTVRMTEEHLVKFASSIANAKKIEARKLAVKQQVTAA
jgi:hypothetical protein